MKVIAAFVLVVCSAVYWYYKNVESFLFLYILPMHLIIGAMGFVMLFGIFSDQKLIKKAIGEHLVETGLFSRIRNEFLSFMCIIFVFTFSLLPVSGFLDSISQDLDGNEIGISNSSKLLFIIKAHLALRNLCKNRE